jgi:hypothetical protein
MMQMNDIHPLLNDEMSLTSICLHLISFINNHLKTTFKMAMATATDRQGFVTSNAIQDTDSFLQRKNITFQPHNQKHWVFIYPQASSDEDFNIDDGEPLFRRVESELSTISQYPRVFSSFNGMALTTSRVLAAFPNIPRGTTSNDDFEMKNAARKLLQRNIRFIGIAAKDSVYRANTKMSSDNPTIQHAGTADVWNFGVTTIEAGDYVTVKLPRVTGARGVNVQGVTRQKMIAEFEKFDSKNVQPTALDVAEEIVAGPAQYSEITRALVDAIQLIANVTRNISDPAAAKLTAVQLDEIVKATLGDVKTPTIPSVNDTRRKVVPELLGSIQEHVVRELSTVVGVAMSKAEPNQKFIIHLKQLAL